MLQSFDSVLWTIFLRAFDLPIFYFRCTFGLVGLSLGLGVFLPSPRVWAQAGGRCADWQAVETRPRRMELPAVEVRFGFENGFWNDLKQSSAASKRSLAFIPLLRALDSNSRALPDLVLRELQRRMRRGLSYSSDFPDEMIWWREYPVSRLQLRGALVQSELVGQVVRFSLPEHDLLTAEFNARMQPQESGRFAVEMLSDKSLRGTQEFIIVYEDNTLEFGKVRLSPLETASSKKDPYSSIRQRTSRYPREGDLHYQDVRIADQPGLHEMMIRSALSAHEKNLSERRERLLSTLAIQDRAIRQKRLDPFDLFLFSPKPEGAKAYWDAPSNSHVPVVYEFNLKLMRRWAPALSGVPFGLINVKDFSSIYESVLEDVLSSRLRADAKSYFLKLNSILSESDALEQKIDQLMWALRQPPSVSEAVALRDLNEVQNRLEILEKQARDYRAKLYQLTDVPNFDSEVRKFLRDFEANLVLTSRAHRLRLGVRGWDPGIFVSPEQLDSIVQQVLQQLDLP
ncbi:MAG: hypothetical protein WCH11_04470 [Bdellovibrio sp.]